MNGVAAYVLSCRDLVEEIEKHTTVRASVALHSLCKTTTTMPQAPHVAEAVCDYYFGVRIVPEELLNEWGLDLKDYQDKLPSNVYLNQSESVKKIGWYCKTNRHVCTLPLYYALMALSDKMWTLFLTPRYVQYKSKDPLSKMNRQMLNVEQKVEMCEAMRRCDALIFSREVSNNSL